MCTDPFKVGFQDDGKTLAWSYKKADKQYPIFELRCGKCIECLLAYSMEWGVRCAHEAQMHPENSFITLTYSDEHLKSPRLNYEDFQEFIAKVRRTQNQPVGYMCVGEYGKETKRPHWHAIVFNWRPRDSTYYRKTERGDRIYTSETLDRLWGKNDPDSKPNEIGAVTVNSASYCARYAAKDLVHGKVGEHPYASIKKQSTKYAIGKKWLETFYTDIFSRGRLITLEGYTCRIPRYYEKWFKENHPGAYTDYVTRVKSIACSLAEARAEKEYLEREEINYQRWVDGKSTLVKTERERREIIKQQQFDQLTGHVKL